MNIHNLNVGSKINGTYYGAFYSGTIEIMRANTADYKQTLLFVNLDQPIPVYSEMRDSIVIYARADGSTVSRSVEIWGIEYAGITKTVGYSMADRFEAVECSPAFAVKLYREMEAQSKERSKALHEMGVWWNNDERGQLAREITIRWSCDVLIRRYTELL